MTAIFPKDRIVTGSLCYIHDAEMDRVLLLKRDRPPNAGLWTAPGGKMELGESPIECCLREIKEETHLTLQDPQLRAIVTVYDSAWPIHWMLFIFCARHYTGTLGQCSEGELRWVARADLDTLPRPFVDQQYIAHTLGDAPGVWQGKFHYHTPDKLVQYTPYRAVDA